MRTIISAALGDMGLNGTIPINKDTTLSKVNIVANHARLALFFIVNFLSLAKASMQAVMNSVRSDHI